MFEGVIIIKKDKLFYGWIIVLACILIAVAAIGAVNSTAGILVKPVCDELGFSRAQFTLYRTITSLVGTVLLPFYGTMVRRIGVKKVMLVCAVGLPASVFSYSFSTQLWHFYFIAAINGIVFNGLSFMTIGILISNWFTDKLGIASGLAYSGSGIGAAIMTPIIGQILVNMGWRFVFQVIGVIGIVILLPTVAFLVKEKPESMGLAPYRDLEKKDSRRPKQKVFVGIALQEAIRTPAFWMLALAFFFLATVASAPNIHTVPYLTDIGYTTVYAASVVSVIMIMLTVAKILLGIFFDRFGALAGSLFLSLCCLVYPLLAFAAKNPIVPPIYAAFYGMACSGISVPVSFLVAKYFGSMDYAAIFGVITMITTLGQSVGPPVMGAIYDSTGSYTLAWILLTILGVMITGTLVGANLQSKRIYKKVETELGSSLT